MKVGLVICGPDVAYGPLALLSGTFEEKINKAIKLGYNGIELMVRDPAYLNWQYIKTTLSNAGLEVPQVVTGELFGADGLCLVTADDDIYRRAEERLHLVIDLAEYLGSMVNIGRVRGRLDLIGGGQQAWNIAVERIGKVTDYAANHGVKITLEPLNRYESDFITSTVDGLHLIQNIGSDNIGLMLDLFHMNIEERSLAESLRQAGNKLWHVHIADSNRYYPGYGHLDFVEVFNALKEMDFKGYISAELLPLPDPDIAAEKTIMYLKAHLPLADRML